MRRGATLVEALISIFLFCSALLIVCNLFHAGMQYNRRADERQLAARLAQNKLEEIVAWSRGTSGASYNYDDWSSLDGATGSFPEAPQVRYEVRVEDLVLANPCSAFNAVALPERQRTLDLKRVHVRVWQSGPTLELTTIIRPPERSLGPTPVQVQAVGTIPSPLPRDQTATFSARLLDLSGVALTDVTFQWYLKPETGSGTLAQTWDGDQAMLTNVIQVQLHPPVYTGGTCRLRVRARYAGREYWGETAAVTLEGP